MKKTRRPAPDLDPKLNPLPADPAVPIVPATAAATNLPPATSNVQPASTGSPLPFAPAPDEPAKAFEAFLCYIDLGPARTSPKVAKLTGVPLATVYNWSCRFQWEKRLHAWNILRLRQRMALLTSEDQDRADLRAARVRYFEDAEWQAAEKLLRVAQNALDVLLAKPAEKVTLAEVARGLDIASKIGRLATGLATDQVAHAGEVNVNLMVEIEDAIKKVYGTGTEDIVDAVVTAPAPAAPAANGAAVP